MRISDALRSLFGRATQAEVAAKLTRCGLPTDQTKVSAWLRGRVPNLEQLVQIEDCYGVPHGTVLALAGFVDVPALATRSAALRPSFALAADADGQKGRAKRRPASRPRPPAGTD